MNVLSPHFVVLLFILAIGGCSSSQDVGDKTPEPYDTLTVGSLNIANLGRRIETNDVARLARIVREENLHVLSIAGITRYPQLRTRVDIVDEIASRIDMYSGFGESATISGRQTGNAVLSVYPIRSQRTTEYRGLQTKSFESAFQAMVDCGLRDVMVVSTHLPEHPTNAEVAACVNTLASLRLEYSNYSMIIAGNLPTSSDRVKGFAVVRSTEGDVPVFWYSNDGSLRLVSQKRVKTPLGTMLVARFGIFRPLLP
jgi:hypothetical protein